MKSAAFPRIAGHACALAAGAGLAWWFIAHRGDPAAAEDLAGDVISSSPADATMEKHSRTGNVSAERKADAATMAGRSKHYREAWVTLLRKDIPFKERESLQKKLLAEWVEVDPQAAIQAALDELGMTGVYPQNGLMSAFSEKIREQPLLFWPLIKEKRFGMATVFFKNQWMSDVGKSDPDLLFSFFSEFSPVEQSRAMTSALEGLKENPARIESLTTHLASQPDTPENRKLWESLGRHLAEHGKLEDLAKSFVGAKTPGEQEIYLASMVRYASWKNTKHGELGEQLDAMPPEAAKKAELAIVRETFYADAIADIATRMIEREDWEALQKEIPIRLHESVPSRDMETFLGWAAELPERSETEDLYRCTVRNHINSDPAKARDWIEAMPAGWKRDNALVEYVNSSLHNRKDSDAAAWAMERIESEHFLSTAEEMKNGWDRAAKK